MAQETERQLMRTDQKRKCWEKDNNCVLVIYFLLWVCWGQMYLIIAVGVMFGGLLLFCVGKKVFEYCSKNCCEPRNQRTVIDEETGEEIILPPRVTFPPWVAPFQCLLCWLRVWQYRPCSRQERGGLHARQNDCPNKWRRPFLCSYGRRIIGWWSFRADLSKALNVIATLLWVHRVDSLRTQCARGEGGTWWLCFLRMINWSTRWRMK